jgi:aryl-alcohol dehydrogenase-like predicted oxidoreductase
MQQLKENIDSIDIQLSDEVLRDISEIHDKYPDPAP